MKEEDMRHLSIVCLAAFLTAHLFSGCANEFDLDVFEPSVLSDPADAIRRVIAEDVRLMAVRLQETPDALCPKATKKYAMAMKDIDLRSCPADFRDAFERHCDAWEEMARGLDSFARYKEGLKSAGDQGIGTDLIHMLQGMAHGEGEYGKLFAAERDIETTWLEVQASAFRYGVEAP
jgi:hypothetical protein